MKTYRAESRWSIEAKEACYICGELLREKTRKPHLVVHWKWNKGTESSYDSWGSPGYYSREDFTLYRCGEDDECKRRFSPAFNDPSWEQVKNATDYKWPEGVWYQEETAGCKHCDFHKGHGNCTCNRIYPITCTAWVVEHFSHKACEWYWGEGICCHPYVMGKVHGEHGDSCEYRGWQGPRTRPYDEEKDKK